MREEKHIDCVSLSGNSCDNFPFKMLREVLHPNLREVSAFYSISRKYDNRESIKQVSWFSWSYLGGSNRHFIFVWWRASCLLCFKLYMAIPAKTFLQKFQHLRIFFYIFNDVSSKTILIFYPFCVRGILGSAPGPIFPCPWATTLAVLLSYSTSAEGIILLKTVWAQYARLW